VDPLAHAMLWGNSEAEAESRAVGSPCIRARPSLYSNTVQLEEKEGVEKLGGGGARSRKTAGAGAWCGHLFPRY